VKDRESNKEIDKHLMEQLGLLKVEKKKKKGSE